MTGPVLFTSVVAVSAAAAAGFGAGLIGWQLLLVLSALCVFASVFYRPFLGVVLLAATIPLENILMYGGLGLGRAIGLAVFGAWFVQKIARRESWRSVVSGGFFPVAIAFLIWILASLLWAQHRPVVRTGFIRIAQMIALALIIIDIADTNRKFDLIAKAVVVSALVAATTILYQFTILHMRRLGADVSGGINDTAAVLTTALPLAFYLVRTSRSFAWGLIGALYMGLGAIAVATMTSRLNLMLLPPLIGILYLLTLRERRGRRWLLAVTIVGAVGAVFVVPWDKLGEQAATIGEYVDETARFGEMQAQTSPRGFHLRIGLAIARDHPIIGVGYGNYGYYFRDEYQFQVPGAGGRVYGSARSPHSSYVGIAADLGAIGLATWLLLLGLCAASAVRAWGRARANGVQGLIPLIEALAIMLGLHIFAYGFYAPNQTDKLLWLIMAMCISVERVISAQTGVLESGENSRRSVLEPPYSYSTAGSLRRVRG